jgi:hypothetical protein
MKSFGRSLVLLVAVLASAGSGAAGKQLIADQICDDGPVEKRADCHARAQAQYVEDRQEELAAEDAERDRQQAARIEELAEERQRDDQERSLERRCDSVVARLLTCGKADAGRALVERSYCKAALQSTDAQAYARTVCLENNSDCVQIDGCFAFTPAATAQAR